MNKTVTVYTRRGLILSYRLCLKPFAVTPIGLIVVNVNNFSWREVKYY